MASRGLEVQASIEAGPEDLSGMMMCVVDMIDSANHPLGSLGNKLHAALRLGNRSVRPPTS
jgi:hypothetical protein